METQRVALEREKQISIIEMKNLGNRLGGPHYVPHAQMRWKRLG
jgi:hypothetical protein